MSHILDIESFEGTVTRVVRKKTEPNTNPLSLERAERKAVDDVAAEIDRNLKIKSLSTYDQMVTFHAAILGMEAAIANDWSGVAAAAQTGLEACFRVQNVTPYLICKQDEAKRNLASDHRNSLKDIALRLGHAARATTRIEIDRALCLRAMTYAAIAADRGLMHLVKDNLGTVVATLHQEDCPARGEIAWTDALTDLAKRYRMARVRMP